MVRATTRHSEQGCACRSGACASSRWMLRVIFCFLVLAVVPLHAGSPIVRNGSTMEKSIPLNSTVQKQFKRRWT
jgi:hypothetical protein